MSEVIESPLTPAEIKRRDALEETALHSFKRATESFKILGDALTEIRDKRLYRDDFPTFKEYCEKKLNLTRRRVDQLIEATSISKDVENQNEKRFLVSESASRTLKNVKPSKRAEVAKAAQKLGGVTTKNIKEVIERKASKPRGGLANEKIESDNKKPAETGKEKLLEALDSWWEKLKSTMAYSVPSPKTMMDDFRKLVEEIL